MSLSIASWNVNSIRVRLPHLLTWLEAMSPTIVLLQETKVEDHHFPLEPLEDLGYNCAIFGQKTYNGVAILSKHPLEDISRGLPSFQNDIAARYVEAFTGGVRVASLYVPNGEALDSPKFPYKLQFLEHLQTHLEGLLVHGEKIIIGGDYNIAPTDYDVYDPAKYRERILSSPRERQAFRRLESTGYMDALRLLYPAHTADGQDLYTWWDYRQGSWEQNHGLRIDHFLVSPQAADSLVSGTIETSLRAKEKPSDHVPIFITLK